MILHGLRIANLAHFDPELYGPNGFNALAGVLFFRWRFQLDEAGIQNLRSSWNSIAAEPKYLRENALLCLEELNKSTR